MKKNKFITLLLAFSIGFVGFLMKEAVTTYVTASLISILNQVKTKLI